MRSEMKLLLVGPYPPPYGGISVHVATAERLLAAGGARCRVLDVGGHRPGRSRTASRLRLLREIRAHARRGWTLHLHTNGHNRKSWLLALACAAAGRDAPARVVTLHSGMVPGYLAGGAAARLLARLALAGYGRVLCVNSRIREAVAALGVDRRRLATAPAYLETPPPREVPPEALQAWLEDHHPVVSTALFFRPEYGFEVLVEALRSLKTRHPGLGCLVLGSGEQEPEASRRLAAEGMEEWVLLAGDVSHPLCLALIARSDLFVRPTLADGDALSVREALALGVPVVASDVGHRPRGVRLFRAGDPAALAAAAGRVLDEADRQAAGAFPAAAGRGAPASIHRPSADTVPAEPDAVAGLLETYRQAAGGSLAYGPAS